MVGGSAVDASGLLLDLNDALLHFGRQARMELASVFRIDGITAFVLALHRASFSQCVFVCHAELMVG
jgi:hypothetical protein